MKISIVTFKRFFVLGYFGWTDEDKRDVSYLFLIPCVAIKFDRRKSN